MRALIFFRGIVPLLTNGASQGNGHPHLAGLLSIFLSILSEARALFFRCFWANKKGMRKHAYPNTLAHQEDECQFWAGLFQVNDPVF